MSATGAAEFKRVEVGGWGFDPSVVGRKEGRGGFVAKIRV